MRDHQGAHPAGRTEFFEEHATIKNTNFIPASESLVRKDWKYFHWPDFKREQLFHLRRDPHEEQDLVNNPAQNDRLVEMRRRFAELKVAARQAWSAVRRLSFLSTPSCSTIGGFQPEQSNRARGKLELL